jgi:hypothetical protein
MSLEITEADPTPLKPTASHLFMAGHMHAASLLCIVNAALGTLFGIEFNPEFSIIFVCVGFFLPLLNLITLDRVMCLLSAAEAVGQLALVALNIYSQNCLESGFVILFLMLVCFFILNLFTFQHA